MGEFENLKRSLKKLEELVAMKPTDLLGKKEMEEGVKYQFNPHGEDFNEFMDEDGIRPSAETEYDREKEQGR